jgi:DNA-binding MarR family transcriptional regulator
MSVKPSADTVEAWARVMHAGQALQEMVEQDLKRAGFPPLAWYDVLYELDRAPNGLMPQSQVQSQTLLAQYNFCRLVDRMEREEVLKRQQCPRDGRSNDLRITEKGRALRKAMWPIYTKAIEANIGARLEAHETRQLSRLFAKLLPADVKAGS